MLKISPGRGDSRLLSDAGEPSLKAGEDILLVANRGDETYQQARLAIPFCAVALIGGRVVDWLLHEKEICCESVTAGG